MGGEGGAGMRFLGYGFEHGVLDEWRGRGWSPESGQLHSVGASAAPSRKSAHFRGEETEIQAER